MSNIMVDLETMGTGAGAVLLSIGAVKFGADGLGEEFYTVIDVDSCMKAGLTVDASTLVWWMKQSAAARKAITRSDSESLFDALTAFTKFVGDKKTAKIWGNGASFDNPILSRAYSAINLEQPWDFWNDRCYRTVKALLGSSIEYVKPEIPHHALEDAKAQARHLIEILTMVHANG